MLPAWMTLIGSLAAALIGAIIAPQFMQAAERRAARARVCEKLMEVEVASWDDEHAHFVKSLASLEAASIVAGVPRLFLTRYIQALVAAREARLETMTTAIVSRWRTYMSNWDMLARRSGTRGSRG